MELEEKFNEIRHFNIDEFDYPKKIDDDALWLLDEMRHKEGEIRKIKIRIHADYATSGHSTKSRHAFGDAFDFSIIDAETDQPLPILVQFSIVSRYPWGGIGIYPFWDSPGCHADRRPWTVTGRRALWYREQWIEIVDSEKIVKHKYYPIEMFFESVQQIKQKARRYHEQINS